MRSCQICGKALANDRLRSCPGECKAETRRRAARKWRASNRDLANERTAAWYRKDLEVNRKKGREAARPKTPEQALERRMVRHGLETDDFLAMMLVQGGACAICREPFAVPNDALLDHDHNCCGKNACRLCFRGLLCRDCNLALGLLHDDRTRLRRADTYLKNGGVFS